MQHTTGTCSYIHWAPLLHCLPSIPSSDKCFGLRRHSTRDLKTCFHRLSGIWHIQLFQVTASLDPTTPGFLSKIKWKGRSNCKVERGKKIAPMLFENSFKWILDTQRPAQTTLNPNPNPAGYSNKLPLPGPAKTRYVVSSFSFSWSFGILSVLRTKWSQVVGCRIKSMDRNVPPSTDISG